MVKSRENLIGAWAFLIGVVLAIIIGLFQQQLSLAGDILNIFLVVLGLLVGFLNVGDKDSNTFLLASVSLVVVSALGNDTLQFISNISTVFPHLISVLRSLLVLFVPATIIVALKTVFSITRI